jgi:hypothetical protein
MFHSPVCPTRGRGASALADAGLSLFVVIRARANLIFESQDVREWGLRINQVHKTRLQLLRVILFKDVA